MKAQFENIIQNMVGIIFNFVNCQRINRKFWKIGSVGDAKHTVVIQMSIFEAVCESVGDNPGTSIRRCSLQRIHAKDMSRHAYIIQQM